MLLAGPNKYQVKFIVCIFFRNFFLLNINLFQSGFIELPLNDQMKLLQVSWAELLTLQLAHRSIPFNGKLMFAKDFWLDERSAKACCATELYYHVIIFLSCIFV